MLEMDGRPTGAAVLEVIDYAERLFVVLLALPFLLAFSRAAAIQPSFLLLLASECLSVIFILIRRPGAIVASPYAFLVAWWEHRSHYWCGRKMVRSSYLLPLRPPL